MMEYEEERDEEEEEEEEEEMDFQTNTNFKLPDTKPATLATAATPRYRECLKNHAVAIGGHAVDGCGEFMPAGPDGTIESFKCAACSCHRNFHRKELISHHHPHPHHHLSVYNPRPQFQAQFYPYNRTATSPSGFLQPRPLALASQARCGGDGGGGSSVGRKRIRTKFTTEQKEKMVELAEKLGWKIQKQDEDVVHQFCQQMGLKRNVLKVWLHNNKHTLGKKP